ncbi:MAG: TolC family protein, partial [Desulfobacterales bacterium]|nr:TolC family protein [Desulfobacterales bacterium]
MNKIIHVTRSLFLFISAVLILVSPAALCGARERLTADRAVVIALENSLQRRMAAKDVEIADEGLARARAEFGPTVTLQSGLYRYDAPPT